MSVPLIPVSNSLPSNIMMPGSKAVHACMIRLLNLGSVKHEKIAIYVVNQRISNVCRIAGECLSAFILSLYYTTRRRDCHSKPEHSPASPPSSFPIVKHPASCSAHLPRRNAYSICVCIQLFRRKANPTPVAKIPAERSSTSSHSPSGVPSPVFGGVA